MSNEVTTPEAHISTVRRLMLEQLHALRNAPTGDALESELKRSKAVSELSQTIINSAKVEVEYLAATKQDFSSFLEEPPEVHTGRVPALPDTPGITRNSADILKPKATPWAGLGSVKGRQAA